MENQQQLTGEAQNSQKKEWYKSGWGLVVAILFFPYFLLWYMWAKTSWSKGVKIAITIVFAFLNIVALASDDTNKNTNQQAEQKPIIAETKTETPAVQQPQAPQFVFNIPALIGKNIDEVKAILGEPTTFKQPTKQQLTFTDIWDMEYAKNDTNLLITYNVKNKVVSDFFIDGTDKNKLLIVGNLQENNDNYTVEFVKSITNANEITGVKVSKKLSEADIKEKAQKELDEFMSLSKKATIVTSYEFSDEASVVYVGKVWYTQTVQFKKDFIAKVATLKKAITGYKHFEVRDAYSNEKVAEVTSFSGSLEVYK